MPDVSDDHHEQSREIRLSFEQLGTLLAILVLSLALAACFLAMYPADWAGVIASRIVQVKDAIFDFLLNLGGILGLSWGRGHLDKRVEEQAGSGK